MSNLQTINQVERRFSKAQIELMKNTICKDANNDEMMVFLQLCASYKLNPFKKEAYLQIFNKNKPEKRNMAIVLSINAYRSMADRSGNYRPDEEEPEYTYDENLKGPLNPLGIEKAVVRVYKQDNKGEWHPIKGAAYWDEFVKTEYGGAINPSWKRMARHMIAKCAEAQALRKGWPETFNGTYLEDEVEQEDVVEYYEKEKTIDMIKAVGGADSFTLQLHDGEPLQVVPSGKMHDVCMDRIREFESSAGMESWWNMNQIAMRQFWVHDKKACHDFKTNFEAHKNTLIALEEANKEDGSQKSNEMVNK